MPKNSSSADLYVVQICSALAIAGCAGILLTAAPHDQHCPGAGMTDAAPSGAEPVTVLAAAASPLRGVLLVTSVIRGVSSLVRR